jgi:hypothetical protein
MNDDIQITKKITDAIAPLQTEIATRNTYIQRRDDFIYGKSLVTSLEWLDGHDKTEYNWLERVVDIHVSQLMGRGMQIYSTYDKRDLSMAEDINDPQQKQQDQMINKRLKANADARRDLIQGIIRDNGGESLFQMGAQSGSAFGFTVYKSWMGDQDDPGDIPWHLEMLENIQNFYALWSSDNFREADGYVYMDQMSLASANQTYGKYLDDGEKFMTSLQGTIENNPNPPAAIEGQGTRQMVSRIEFTGVLPEIRGENGNLYDCQPGEETRVNILSVGGKIVRTETDENKLPMWYIIPNQRVMRRPWGMADVTDTCIEINRTYLERMSDWITLGNKILFPKWAAKNFDITTVPRPKTRTAEMIPMDADQSIELINTFNQFSYEYPKMIQQLQSEFIRSARISRVLFDDPQAAASNSNQALMTSMKGTIDAVEKKQQIWQSVLIQIFEDALRVLGRALPQFRDFVDEKDNWNLYIKWPSVLRKEDPVYQQMLINRFNIGSLSVDTLLEEEGVPDAGEELDRIRDNMSDPVTAAILGRQLPALAQRTIVPPLDPTKVYPSHIKHTVAWRADLTPQQEANLASTIPGFQDGPFGMSQGPQGQAGAAANSNAENVGFLNGDPFHGGTPVNKDQTGKELSNYPTPVQGQGQPGAAPAAPGAPAPGGPAAAPAPGVNPANGAAAPSQIATPGQNQPGSQPVSQPGSGATPVSPKGAIKKKVQNHGG